MQVMIHADASTVVICKAPLECSKCGSRWVDGCGASTASLAAMWFQAVSSCGRSSMPDVPSLFGAGQ